MKNRISDISALLICAALSSAAGSMAAKTFSLALPLGYIILLPLAFTLVIYLLLLNKKVALIAFFGAIIALGVIYLRLTPENKLLVSDFFEKSFDFIKNGSEISELYAKILGSLMLFIISLVLILPTVIFPFFPAVLAISLALILTQWKSHSTTMLYEAIIMLGCVSIFFARTMRINASDNARHVRNISSAWLTPAVAAAIMCVAFIATGNNLDSKWEWLEIRTNIINDYFAELSGNSSPRSVFDISSVGYEPLDGRLGGPVELDDTELFDVKSAVNYSLLFRGNIKNTYTGYGWTDDSVSYRYRMIGKFKDEQEDVFNLNIPPTDYRYYTYIDKTEIFITPLQNGTATIFGAYRTLDVKPEKLLTMLISFNTEGELFSSRDISKGISYSVIAEYAIQNATNFTEYVDIVQSSLSEDEQQYGELISLNYTSQFEAVPQSVADLAQSITDGIEGDYQKALAIKAYLENDGFIYTLKPEIPPEDQDFVEHFLETKRGYCTYYASAMAVLARNAGLPSRYVEGFKSDGKNRDFTLTGENAHAWAEIYIKGLGWLPFDPATSEETSNNASPVEETIPEDLFDMPSQQPDIDIPLQDMDEPSGLSPLLIFVIVLLSLLAAAGIIFGTAKARASMFMAKRAGKDINGITLFYFKEIMVLMSHIKYEKPIGHTLEEYSKGADNRIVLPGHTFKRVSDVVSKLIYAQRDLDENDMKAVYGYYASLNRYIRQRLGIPRYFIITASVLFKSLFQSSAQLS